MAKFHLRLFTHYGRPAFRNRDEYHAMWCALRETFPAVFACALMPDHLHLAIECPDGETLKRALERLTILARAYAREHHGQEIWAPAPIPETIQSDAILLRVIRYIHLNPCRKGLSRDPLEWEWTTHLDAMGATAPAWIDLTRLRHLVESVLIRSRLPWRERFHQYVSGDPSVEVESTACPRPSQSLVTSLDEVGRAVLIASRTRSLTKSRRPSARGVMIHLSRRIGHPRQEVLAQYLGTTVRSVHRLLNLRLNSIEVAQAEGAWLVLSDGRIGKVSRPDIKLL